MKIEEIPIREIRWSGRSRFLRHSPYGEEVWRSSRRERQRMQSYYSRTASDLQRLVEAECDRMDYRGSMMYDEFPDRLMMEHTCRNIARQYSRENGGKDEKTAEEELLDLIGVLFYNEMFRRRSRRKHYYNLWL